MTFKEIADSLECRILNKNSGYDSDTIKHIVAGDLMSEVLVAEEEDLILISSLSSDQVVRTAHVVDAMGIILVNDKTPQDSTLKLAAEFDITVISTPQAMFECCCSVSKIKKEVDAL